MPTSFDCTDADIVYARAQGNGTYPIPNIPGGEALAKAVAEALALADAVRNVVLKVPRRVTEIDNEYQCQDRDCPRLNIFFGIDSVQYTKVFSEASGGNWVTKYVASLPFYVYCS